MKRFDLRLRVFTLLLCSVLLTGMGCGKMRATNASNALIADDPAVPTMKAENMQMLGNFIVHKKDAELAACLDKNPALANKSYAGKTLLFTAAFFGDVRAALTLVNHGADVNFTTALGETPLDDAERAGATGVIDYLQQKGAHKGTKR